MEGPASAGLSFCRRLATCAIKHRDAYIQRATDHASGREQSLAFLRQAVGKASLKLARALASGDERSWHKFRIAVKEVRYLADASVVEPLQETDLEEVISACKELQEHPGNWHDAVIQLHMLEDLEAADVHTGLASVLEERRRQFLSQARDALVDNPVFRILP